MPGALDLIAELRGRRPLAVASNSHRHLVDLAVGGSNLADAFDAIVASDEVPRPKPAPDLYLEACRRLGSSPEATVAIEDSPPGAAAARAAGLFVIGILYLPDLPVEADVTGRSLADPAVRTALDCHPLERLHVQETRSTWPSGGSSLITPVPRA
jgi:beta-phosphoglucomutase-like phosphatase (HAD superfamily)